MFSRATITLGIGPHSSWCIKLSYIGGGRSFKVRKQEQESGTVPPVLVQGKFLVSFSTVAKPLLKVWERSPQKLTFFCQNMP